MKRLWIVLGVAALAGLMLAASGQVTREEFDALAGKVAGLEARCALLDISIKRLDRQQATAPGLPAPPEEAEAATGEPLTGNDLIAWKFARDAAQDNRRARNREAKDDAARASRSWMAHLQAAGPQGPGAGFPGDPRADVVYYTVQAGQPVASIMHRTAEGDYLFFFHSLPEEPRPGRHPEVIYVTITDFGTELRVEDIQWFARP